MPGLVTPRLDVRGTVFTFPEASSVFAGQSDHFSPATTCLRSQQHQGYCAVFTLGPDSWPSGYNFTTSSVCQRITDMIVDCVSRLKCFVPHLRPPLVRALPSKGVPANATGCSIWRISAQCHFQCVERTVGTTHVRFPADLERQRGKINDIVTLQHPVSGQPTRPVLQNQQQIIFWCGAGLPSSAFDNQTICGWWACAHASSQGDYPAFNSSSCDCDRRYYLHIFNAKTVSVAILSPLLMEVTMIQCDIASAAIRCPQGTVLAAGKGVHGRVCVGEHRALGVP